MSSASALPDVSGDPNDEDNVTENGTPATEAIPRRRLVELQTADRLIGKKKVKHLWMTFTAC